LHGRRRESGARGRDCRQIPRYPVLPDRGASDHGSLWHGDVMLDLETEEVLRQSAPHVLGALVRRFGQFDIAEDAVQEALLAAAVQWPDQGMPANPQGWLYAV